MYRIDFLQIHLKCCGINSFTDWKNNAVLSQSNSVPDTCCISPSINCGSGALDKLVTNQTAHKRGEMENEIYLMGCIQRIQVLFKHNCLVIGFIVIGILGIQISAIFLSWCLSEQMRGRWWNYRYTKTKFPKRNHYQATKSVETLEITSIELYSSKISMIVENVMSKYANNTPNYYDIHSLKF